jgi:DNA-binding response OmpR family regulator
VFSDLLDADDFLIKLKEQEIDTSVIISSGQKNESFVNKILNLGTVDYISKPFSPIELDARLGKNVGLGEENGTQLLDKIISKIDQNEINTDDIELLKPFLKSDLTAQILTKKFIHYIDSFKGTFL